MAVSENKAIVSRCFDRLSARDMDGLLKLYAQDAVFHGFMPMELTLDAYAQFTGQAFAAFADLHFTVEDLLGEGDEVAARYSWSGTQTGAVFGIPPTDRAVTVPSICIFRLAAGQIAAVWLQGDNLGLMQQLGQIPVPQTS